MFDFLNMLGNYEERNIDKYKNEKIGLYIDTSEVTDKEKQFETGIKYPDYNENYWIIVESYDTREKAQKGHCKWVKRMTKRKLPIELMDIHSVKVFGKEK